MDVLVICRDVLCSKEINKEKFDLTSKFWLFHFSAKSSTFLTSSLVPIFMSIESNHSKWWIDRPGQRCQSPTEVYGRKIESNAYTF